MTHFIETDILSECHFLLYEAKIHAMKMKIKSFCILYTFFMHVFVKD